MKVLNRPMFRYGGPIKEGVMSGIKEPRQRYQEAGSVQPQYQYKFSETPIAKGAKGFAAYGPNAGIAAIYDLAAVPINTLGRAFGYNPGLSGTKFVDTLTGGEFSRYTGYDPNVARFLGFKTSAKKGFTTPSMGGGKEANLKALEKDPNIGKTTKELGIEESESEKKSKVSGVKDTKPETQAERIQRYRDIMDIKGMNKAAAYDSLIAASKAVGESQDFKGDLKSGKLINQIIQSASKAFDKPKATKDAIDTLILKGEIEKDIKASDPSNEILNELRKVQIKAKEKELEGNNFAENKAVQLKAGNTGQSAIDGAAAMDNPDFRGNLVTKSDLSDIIETQKKAGELDEETIVISYTNTLLAKNKDGITDGDYTVGEFLVTIKDNKVYDITR